MPQSATYKSYLQSLLWFALFAAVAAGVANDTHLVIFDFIHGNPHRTVSDTIEMMCLFPVIFVIISPLVIILVFGIPQLAQAAAAKITEGWRYQVAFLIALTPLVGVMTWYCWDYLTPSDFNLAINEGPDWEPYRHGITFQRYMDALLWQTPLTVFSLMYYKMPLRFLSRRRLVQLMLLLSCVSGIALGYMNAEAEIRQFM